MEQSAWATEDEVALLKERLEAKDMLELEKGCCVPSHPPPVVKEKEKESAGMKTKGRTEGLRREWMTSLLPIVLPVPRMVPIMMLIVKMRRKLCIIVIWAFGFCVLCFGLMVL
ncbi:hypothetical protein BDQ17DRAFT_1430235 [Cyathus striatus]|nr:hypothetical protein BDQ17DRAFT_1430235 [Cyathus striatus]